MRRAAPGLLGLLLMFPVRAPAQEAPELNASYDMYAAGFHVADMRASFGVNPENYRITVAYHTTGVMSVLHHGHQLSTVAGTWDAGQPQPRQFQSVGVWQGEDKVTVIDYRRDQPLVRRLIPPQDAEREPVPLSLQQNSVDSLSAVALLIHRVADTGRCEASVHTFDGNRASEIAARTAGQEVLPPTGRSVFSGPALRCDFVGRMLAGFLRVDASAYARRALHGSAWLARLGPGEPPVPVRMTFETHWFGDVTLYLTQFGLTPLAKIAAH